MIRLLILFLFTVVSTTLLAQRPADNVLAAMEREAQEFMQQEKFQEAAAIFDKIITATGLEREEDYLALYRRSICNYYLGKTDMALNDINAFMPHNPGRSTPFLLRSLLHRSADQYALAVEDLNKVLTMNTGEQDSAQVLRLRSAAYLELRQYPDAIRDVRWAMKSGEDPEGLSILAFAYFNLDDEVNGLMAVHRSIELDFSYLPSYLYAASFFTQNGKNQLAVKYARLATMVDDTSMDAWFYLGAALVNLDELDQGCSCLNKAFYGGNDNAAGYLSQYCFPVEN